MVVQSGHRGVLIPFSSNIYKNQGSSSILHNYAYPIKKQTNKKKAGGRKEKERKDTMKNVVWERWKEYYSQKMESDNAVKKNRKLPCCW